MLLNHFLEHSARRLPEKTALVFRGLRLTYRELDDLASRLSDTMRAEGVRRQDHISILLENSAEAVVAIFGVLKAGAVFSLHHAGAKGQLLQPLLADARTRGLITDARRFETLKEILPQLPDLKWVMTVGRGPSAASAGAPRLLSWEEALRGSAAAPPAPRCIDLDLAAILYTSSTTGRSKGVMLTHLNMISVADSVTQYLENTEQDIILNVLPLSFSYGLYQVLTACKMGATVILERPFLYPYPVIDLLVKERVTGFPLVPTIAALLMQLKDLSRYDFSCLRYLTSAAQAISPRQIEALRAMFPAAKLYSMYGQTECKRISYLPPEELDRRPTSVGKAIPNTETYLVDENGRRVTEPGRIGELVVRGPHVMQGYWNLPEETARRLRPGDPPWEKHLHTGDLFKMDEEGFLYFVARKDDLIKTAGELVSPKEVEDALCEFENVLEAAVVGKPDEVLGQAIYAFVVLNEPGRTGEPEIIRHCAARLENYKVPRSVRILTAMPKTPTGKIAKKEL